MNLIIHNAKKNKKSFMKLINSIKTDLYRIAKSKLNNEEDVNDILQDTIIDIYTQLNNLKKNEYFKTWAIKILINNCNDKLREKYQINNYNKIINLDDSISDDEIFDIVYTDFNYKTLMGLLSENEKIIFALYYEEDLKIKEISEILNLKENTIKSIIRRGKQKIRKKYGRDEIYG